MARHALTPDDDFTPDTAPVGPEIVPNAPLGTVNANVHVEVGGLIGFDAAVRGAIVDASKTEGFRNLHQHEDGSVTPVKSQYICPACDVTSGFVKGRPKGDSYVIVPQEIIDQHEVADEKHKGNLTVTLHKASEVTHALPNGKVTYLAPSKKTNGQYADLAAAMVARPDLAFVGIMATKKIAYRYLLTSDGTTITLNQLADPELVRVRPTANVEPTPRLERFLSFIDGMVEPFVAQERASQRSKVVEEYVDAAEPVALRSADGDVQAAPVGDYDAQIAAAEAKFGTLLKFPDTQAS